MNVNVFRAIGDLALGAQRRQNEEYSEFLKFYRDLVETLPSEVTTLFGNLSVKVKLKAGAVADYGLELTATDYLWWKSNVEKDGLRFVDGPEAIKRSMLNRFSKQAETYRLTPEERKKIIDMVDPVG